MPEGSEPIVVNTGPIIALRACGSLDLLARLHAPVIVPDAVVEELARGGSWGGRSAVAAGHEPGLDVHALITPPSPLLTEYLEGGEASVIALAVQQNVPLVAIDERRGRMVARAFGLRVTGGIGILLRAKRLGLGSEIRSALVRMRRPASGSGSRLSVRRSKKPGRSKPHAPRGVGWHSLALRKRAEPLNGLNTA